MNNVKLKIVATVSVERYIYVETREDLEDLYCLVRWQLHPDSETFPAFSIRIPGDTASVSIFEGLYALGSFIASMGIDVPTASDSLIAEMDAAGCAMEANLCRALALFWPALQNSGCGTYDSLFLKYGDVSAAATLGQKRLLPMRHLLIDEFQDISGQIVKWIKAVHAVLSQQGDEPSLLVVGDDWQSVYGWRGSDPEYLVDFDYRFGPSFLIAMNDNFRCGQQIINVAELLVANLRGVIAGKHGIAAGEAGQTMGGVTLCRMSDSEVHDLVKKYGEKIRKGRYLSFRGQMTG